MPTRNPGTLASLFLSVRLALLVSACAAIVIVLGLLAYESLQNLAESSRFAAEAERARSQLSKVLEDLTQMGSGVRQYQATADKGAFAEADAAAAALPADLQALEPLSQDATERSLLGPLHELAALRAARTRHLIDEAVNGNVAEVDALVEVDDGPRLMSACRALIGRMQARQSELLVEREAFVAHARVVARWAIGVTTALATVMLFLVASLTTRHAARLRGMQEELATTLRSIGDAVISTDADGRVRFMNAVAEELTGWSTKTARGLPLERVFQICNEATREPLETPVSQVLKDHGVVGLANHTLLISRDGMERPIEDSGAPIRGSDGRIIGVVLVFRDASKERAAQRALLESESQLREANATLEQKVVERAAQLAARETLIHTFYEHSSECHAVLVVNSGGHFRYEEVNPATLRLYGKTREEVVGHTIEEVFEATTAATLTGHLSDCLITNVPLRYERVHGDRMLEAIATPVIGTGPHRRVVVSARDVTDRRALEQQLLQSRKMEAVGQLTGGLAHDFNNLLSGISGSFELLQTRVAQGRLADLDRFVAAGQAAARRAAALTHRLLAFSRRQTLDAKLTDVNRLIADMVELISRTAGPEISIEVVGGMGLWHPLVDANQLENAVLNLCINARDAMPDGGKITIETANRWIDERMANDLASGQYISICISDTGCGMSPEVAARAFEPFYTTKPLGQGTGLGLSMIYGFARQSGGQVRIYSEVGKGAMVCIYLPRAAGAQSPEAAQPVLSPAILQSPGRTVLVVDDEAVVRMLVVEVLQDLGCVAVECDDGISALQVLQSSRPLDLLITDVGLPNGMNGRQLADAARNLRPDLNVLFITGYAENAVFSHGHVEAGLEVLTKPFAIEELARRIVGLLPASSHPSQAELRRPSAPTQRSDG
jgi:PAS domain S-box-containing protein